MRLPDIGSVIGHRGAREPTGTDPGVCHGSCCAAGFQFSLWQLWVSRVASDVRDAPGISAMPPIATASVRR